MTEGITLEETIESGTRKKNESGIHQGIRVKKKLVFTNQTFSDHKRFPRGVILKSQKRLLLNPKTVEHKPNKNMKPEVFWAKNKEIMILIVSKIQCTKFRKKTKILKKKTES